jgi:hypothetical protein
MRKLYHAISKFIHSPYHNEEEYPVLIIYLFSIATFAQHSKKDLFGKWEGKDETNRRVSIAFLDSAKASLFMDGSLLLFPPSPYLPNGSSPFSYSVNLMKTPGTIVFTMKAHDGGVKVLKGLIQFLDNDTIKWQIFFDRETPTDFDNSNSLNTTVILTRINPIMW